MKDCKEKNFCERQKLLSDSFILSIGEILVGAKLCNLLVITA